MTVLVTGASGFLGRAVARTLQYRGEQVRTFQRRPSGVAGVQDVAGSITDITAVRRAVSGVDAVIHLAARVSLVGSPAEFHTVNVVGTETLLDAAADAGVAGFVHVSSPSVAHVGNALVGVGAQAADAHNARGEYARTKAAGELLALSRDSSMFHVVAVRPHLVWGPGDTQIVERVVDRARRGRLPLLGHGAALIDTTYVDNAAEGIVAALDHVSKVHGNAYVITNGEPRTVADLLTGICLAAGTHPPAWRVPPGLARAVGWAVESVWRARPGTDEPPMTQFLAEQLSTAHWFDQRATQQDLHWTPRVSIDEGLELLAAHYRGAAAQVASPGRE